MPHPEVTAGPRAKLERAREHLDGLEAAYDEWFQQGNPVATVELEEVAPTGHAGS
jgi:hypothetical protein